MIEEASFGGMHVVEALTSATLSDELDRLARRDFRSRSLTLPSLALTSAGVSLAWRDLACWIAKPNSDLTGKNFSGESVNKFFENPGF